MSEQNEPRVSDPIDDGEAGRTEYGRQLAMDGILDRACGEVGAAADGGRAPKRTRWGGLMVAAVLVLGVGLGITAMLQRRDGLGLWNGLGPQPQIASDSGSSVERTKVVPSRKEPPILEPGAAAIRDASPAEQLLQEALAVTAEAPPSPTAASESLRSHYRDGVTPVAPPANREEYDRIVENDFRRASEHPLSTFSIDVDTAAYANARDLLRSGALPRPDAVRVEEMINYFDYDYPQPKGEHPVAIHVDMAQAPWAPRHRLVRVGLQARNSHVDRPRANLVFLIDVSGSMSSAKKLPLLKRCMAGLVTALRNDDRVAIVVYAGAAGLVLDSTAVGDEEKVLQAITRLQSGGSTNGGAGIELAYKVAAQNFVAKGINRVILASDGDFNVGVSDRASLISMIEQKRQTGVFLSVLGFGRGNLRDSQMEQIANKGNGTYSFIDSIQEGHRVLVDKIGSTLVTVAKDVKIQVEFNPALVAGYRLIGYENRMLSKQDFNDDTKDAGEVGSGHSVTALYEVIPASVGLSRRPPVDPLRYEKDGKKPESIPAAPARRATDELLFVKVRYKLPAGDTSTKLTLAVNDVDRDFESASDDFRFAASVAAFGMVLRRSKHQGLSTYATVLDMAEGALGEDPGGYRNGFLKLVTKARQLDPRRR